jgi:Lipocalin-like domain
MGEQRVDPALGADPIALLIYDAGGHFAAQFMKRDRSRGVESSAASTSQNNSRAQGGYDAYFGTYRTDDDNNTVTQTLTGALSQENVGQTLTREMNVLGDELTIQLATVAATGEPVTRTLKWKRVG